MHSASEDGQCLLDVPALSGDGPVVLDIADGRARLLDVCEPTRARVRRSPKRVRVSARWRDCGAPGRGALASVRG